MSVTDVMAEFATSTNSERGTKFEELMVSYFQRDPMMAAQYDEVMRWKYWPHRGTSPDVGIDLVAHDAEQDTWTAIQCKFYAPTHRLQKSDIDSFFTASGKRWDGISFTNRIIISTTDHWSTHAEEALANQQIPVQRIGVAELDSSPIEWSFADRRGLDVRLKMAPKFEVREHQRRAIDAIMAGFTTNDRGKWISACGTGKTFTSLRLAEKMATPPQTPAFGSCFSHRASN